MAAHTREQREFIVRHLAAFYSPETIVQRFAARWPDTTCQVPDVQACNPKLNVVAPELCALFDAERVRFLDNLEGEAPTADKRLRMVELHRMFEIYRDARLFGNAAAILEQIAREQDGDGEGGGNVPSGAPAVERRITRTVVDPATTAAESA